MYIGVYEIVKETEDNGYTTVSYKPQGKDEVPDEVFFNEVLDKVKTKKPTDFNFIRDERCRMVEEKILEVLLKYNVKTSEIDYVSKLLVTSLQNSIDRADNKLWGNESHNRTLRHIEEVLKS